MCSLMEIKEITTKIKNAVFTNQHNKKLKEYIQCMLEGYLTIPIKIPHICISIVQHICSKQLSQE